MHTESLSRPLRLRWTERGAGWLAGAALIALAVLAPLLTLGWWALGGDLAHWQHLASYVLPQALANTLILLAGVGALVALLGTGSAWLVTAYEFPTRRTLTWALLLPLAVPTYIIAFAYLDLLHPIGPIQTGLRAILGYDSPRQFRLPDLRSIQGAIFVLGFVLYPYVYLSTRVMFMTQAASLLEARAASAPAAPACSSGGAAAGASGHRGRHEPGPAGNAERYRRLGIPGRADADRLGLHHLGHAFRPGRRGPDRADHAGHRRRPDPAGTAWTQAPALCQHPAHAPDAAAPPARSGGAGRRGAGLDSRAAGLRRPALYLVVETYKRLHLVGGVSGQLLVGLRNTLTVAFCATVVTLLCGLTVAWAGRTLRESAAFNPGRACGRIASLSYAVPGTVLAIGLLTPFVGSTPPWAACSAAAVYC